MNLKRGRGGGLSKCTIYIPVLVLGEEETFNHCSFQFDERFANPRGVQEGEAPDPAPRVREG